MTIKKTKKIVVLATGGTISGLADDPNHPADYVAGRLPVDALLSGVATSTDIELVTEQLAQIDSKDMSFKVWQDLLRCVTGYLAHEDVLGAVITHGTDTIEETAFFLDALLGSTKPVALTCSMLPANAPDSDGPSNLRDALNWVQTENAQGVVVVCAGQVHLGGSVQKTNSQARNPFMSNPINRMSSNMQVPTVQQVLELTKWPRVDVVMNHAGADGRLVRLMTKEDAPDGWVVAATGNGTLHTDLELALLDAQKNGAHILRASRCAWGGVQSRAGDVFAHAQELSVPQARVALLFHLIKSRGL